MSVLGWIVVGALAGGIARRVVDADKRGCVGTVAIGIVGAFIGGALYRLVRGDDVEVFDDFDWGSIGVATLGSIVLLLVLDAVAGRRATRR